MDTFSLDYLNHTTQDEFVDALGDLFEHSPWVAVNSYPQRPFASLEALHAALVESVAVATTDQQLALIRAHPDLAGKAARAGDLTHDSSREQTGAGLDRLTKEEYERFHRLNETYRAKFDFPFIVAVKGHNKDSILGSFEERLGNELAAERQRALAEIAKIARFRLEERLGG